MENSDVAADDSKDEILEDGVKSLKTITDITDYKSKFMIKTLESIMIRMIGHSYIFDWNGSTETVRGVYVHIFEPDSLENYVKPKEDGTAPFAPLYIKDDELGVLSMGAQGISFYNAEIAKLSGASVVGLETILSGTRKTNDADFASIDTVSGRIKASRIITNYYNLDDYNERDVTLFITDEENMEGYCVSTEYVLNKITTSLPKLIDDCLSKEDSELKYIILSSMAGLKQKVGGRKTLYKFRIDNDNVTKTYLNSDNAENAKLIEAILKKVKSIMKENISYDVDTKTYINGNPIDFHDMMHAYRRSYSKVLFDYLTSVKLEFIDGKVRYMSGAKHISYKKDEFMAMVNALAEEDASAIKKLLDSKMNSEKKVNDKDFEKAYG